MSIFGKEFAEFPTYAKKIFFLEMKYANWELQVWRYA